MKTCTKCKVEKELREFYKHKSHKDGLRSQCKDCIKDRNSVYYKDNKEGILLYCKKYTNKEGYGVYIADYGCGKYVGSGLITARRNHHLCGSARIAKKLGLKALSFDVTFYGQQQECLDYEQRLIDNIGIENLLNSVRVKS